MYQFLLAGVILLCIGFASYVTISQGSASKVYTVASSQEQMYEDIDKNNDTLRTIEEIEQEGEDGAILAAFKTFIGVENEAKVSPLAARTVTGTYACNTSTTTPNCNSQYTFIFKATSAAVLRISNEFGQPTTTEVGQWAFNEDGQIVVTLYADAQKRFDEERRFTLDRSGKGSELVAIEYPTTYYPDILTGIFRFIKK